MSSNDANRPQRLPPIDFGRLADALLRNADSWVSQWLPRGVHRNGRWYVGDFDGGDGESANVCLKTGRWIDNAAPDVDKGGDLISLYARIHNLNNGQAARALMDLLGWNPPAPRSPPWAAECGPETTKPVQARASDRATGAGEGNRTLV